MIFEVLIEPKKDMDWEKMKSIIQKAFESEGGLSENGLQLLNVD